VIGGNPEQQKKKVVHGSSPFSIVGADLATQERERSKRQDPLTLPSIGNVDVGDDSQAREGEEAVGGMVSRSEGILSWRAFSLIAGRLLGAPLSKEGRSLLGLSCCSA
jgi:hypothetical protein